MKLILLFHIDPDYGGHQVGQHFSLAEAVPMTLAACLTTGNDLSVRDRGGGALSVSDRGGALTRATAASSVFGSTTSDATNDQVDPLMTVEEGKENMIWKKNEKFSILRRTRVKS